MHGRVVMMMLLLHLRGRNQTAQVGPRCAGKAGMAEWAGRNAGWLFALTILAQAEVGYVDYF